MLAMTVVYIIGWVFILFCYVAHMNDINKITGVVEDITAAYLVAAWPIVVPISLWMALRAKQRS